MRTCYWRRPISCPMAWSSRTTHSLRPRSWAEGSRGGGGGQQVGTEVGHEGRQPGREIGRAQGPDVLPVDRIELGLIEHRGAVLDLLQFEGLDELLELEELLPSSRRPSQEGKEIHHRLGQVPQVAEFQ